MRGVGAAAAIALINSIGNTGGFVGPVPARRGERRDAPLHRRAVRHCRDARRVRDAGVARARRTAALKGLRYLSVVIR